MSGGKTGQDAGGLPSGAESVLRALIREYEIRNVAGFMDLVHDDYETGTMDRDDLRYQLSRDQGQYGDIEVELYGVGVRNRGSTMVILTNWELSWTCRSPGPGCARNDDEVRRRGRTAFVFRRSTDRDSEGWRLVSERASPFFGRFQQGRVVP